MTIKTAFVGALATILTTPAFAQDNTETLRGPAWSLDVGAIYLHRSNTSSDTLATTGPPLTTISAAAVDDLTSFGGVATLSGSMWDVGVEFRAIVTATARDKAAGQFDNAGGIVFGELGVLSRGIFAPFPVNTDFSFKRETSFHSLEANVDLYQANNFRIFAGARGLSIGDDLKIAFNIDRTQLGINTDTETRVDNKLLGLQLGIDGDIPVDEAGKWTVGGALRAAAMVNNIDARYRFSTAPTFGNLQLFASDDDRRFSALGELELRTSYALTENFDISLSYNLIAISNVASSVETFSASSISFANVASTRIADRTAIYHGVMLRGRVRF